MLECWKNGIGKNGRVEEWKNWNGGIVDGTMNLKTHIPILQRSNIPLTEGEK